MKLWSVSVAFNVQAPTQDSAVEKVRAYLDRSNVLMNYEEIEEPRSLGDLTLDDLESCIL